MLRSRIIPCLLIHKKGLVKTVKFKEPKYVGDPINAVKIFNEKEVDELIVLDIDATKENRGPNLKMIKNIADECRMPLCYGGGITTVEQAVKIIGLGVEKIALSYSALNDIELCQQIGDIIGNQSVVVVVDVRKKKLFGGYDIYTHNGTIKSKWNLFDYIAELEGIGVGEIVINSIDNEFGFYFVHSFYFECVSEDNILATSNYGTDFTSAIYSGHIIGTQFHPEKSHGNGVLLFKNFAQL